MTKKEKLDKEKQLRRVRNKIKRREADIAVLMDEIEELRDRELELEQGLEPDGWESGL